MASLSLTPRETSSGLRPPRAAAPPRYPAATDVSKVNFLPEARGASKKPDRAANAGDPLPIPTREEIRSSARALHDRRVHNRTKLTPSEGPSSSLSEAIKQRMQLTLKQAFAQPDSADVNAAREAELQRQRHRVEDLQRTFDMLHAELVGKEEVRAPNVHRSSRPLQLDCVANGQFLTV